jgi:hypothetical protein
MTPNGRMNGSERSAQESKKPPEKISFKPHATFRFDLLFFLWEGVGGGGARNEMGAKNRIAKGKEGGAPHRVEKVKHEVVGVGGLGRAREVPRVTEGPRGPEVRLCNHKPPHQTNKS